ncbi:phosphoenolpyruvate--protein phosphotransferase [Paenibacillus frigoriresistens]|uniref:phosphoenolpyruvate--protein phosphotransferase n=1 Tax=Paenibacillus alginolyticus TaxID=59839 RepID=UPI001567B859|nr:phosphoenolpyruvate--protein phosphotransferase [Paenibacillus frigoriresistens]NRF95846.1 phosphoenolpyruvate--protein phosphotransferase [Paenibacillus frigoriresistens]
MNLQGIAAAPGIAMGPAFILQQDNSIVEKYNIDEAELEAETKRFEAKVNVAIEQLQQLIETTRHNIGDEKAKIFETHIFLLEDEELVGAAKEAILAERINAEAALDGAAQAIIAMFESMEDENLRERAADIRDVTSRVMRLLKGQDDSALTAIQEPVVLIAHDLTPSDTAQLNRNKTVGFITEIGGKTSHSAIMARSMQIPAVVGLRDAGTQVQSGDYVILDGNRGVVLVNPGPEMINHYKQLQRKDEARQAELRRFMERPSVTADGHKVELAANIGNPKDAFAAKGNGAEGIGLYRSEFLYMGRNDLPTEDEQYQAYKVVAEMFGQEQPVVIRTLDIGGDKELPYLSLPEEANPFLGYRAIRLCLDQVELFKTQLRAIVRASAFGNIKLMYPMIATLQELRQANALLNEVKAGLEQENIAFNRQMEVGMMIEVPGAAIIADQLAKEVDFFSIGTNDLVQYVMAADRMNERVSYLSEPLQPAVLRIIKQVIDAAHARGKWVGMCGEMAGNLTAVPILLGMGLDEFSMGGGSVLPVRALLNKLRYSEMRALAEEVLELVSSEEIRSYVESNVPAIAELNE